MPKRLFSHNDQQSTWMSFAPEGSRLGWGGLFGDVAASAGANSESIYLEISDESGVLNAISEPDERSEQRLDDLIRRQLGIGDEP